MNSSEGFYISYNILSSGDGEQRLYPEPNTPFNYVNKFVFLCKENFLFTVYSLGGCSFKPLVCLLKFYFMGFYQFDSFLSVYYFKNMFP